MCQRVGTSEWSRIGALKGRFEMGYPSIRYAVLEQLASADLTVTALSERIGAIRNSVQLVASFAAVGLAGCQRHSRTCEAGWIVAKNGGYRVVEEDNIVSNANGRGATVHGAMRHP